MKKLLYLFLACVLLVGCRDNRFYLDQTEAWWRVNSDSMLYYLQKVDSASLTPEEALDYQLFRMRASYACMASGAVTGGTRLGIMTAPAKSAERGAVSFSISPSRRCRCMSSGAFSVISMPSILSYTALYFKCCNGGIPHADYSSCRRHHRAGESNLQQLASSRRQIEDLYQSAWVSMVVSFMSFSSIRAISSVVSRLRMRSVSS